VSAGGAADVCRGQRDETHLCDHGVAAAAQEPRDEHQPGGHGRGHPWRVLLQPGQVSGESVEADPAPDPQRPPWGWCPCGKTADAATAVAEPFHLGAPKGEAPAEAQNKFFNFSSKLKDK
jgi:hypothetical protein